jgi:hypothetical protein
MDPPEGGGLPEEPAGADMPIMSFLDIPVDPPTGDGVYAALLELPRKPSTPTASFTGRPSQPW